MASGFPSSQILGCELMDRKLGGIEFPLFPRRKYHVLMYCDVHCITTTPPFPLLTASPNPWLLPPYVPQPVGFVIAPLASLTAHSPVENMPVSALPASFTTQEPEVYPLLWRTYLFVVSKFTPSRISISPLVGLMQSAYNILSVAHWSEPVITKSPETWPCTAGISRHMLEVCDE